MEAGTAKLPFVLQTVCFITRTIDTIDTSNLILLLYYNTTVCLLTCIVALVFFLSLFVVVLLGFACECYHHGIVVVSVALL